MNLLKLTDQAAFYVTVSAALTAVVASLVGEVLIGGIAGTVAAIAPIVNRIVNGRFLMQLGTRSISKRQRDKLVRELSTGLPFELWVAHNRHEAEPTGIHTQISEALQEAGLTTNYFGGMTNSTRGIEISGPPSDEKTRLMRAFTTARIPFVNVEFTDAGATGFGGLAVWIGVHPGLR